MKKFKLEDLNNDSPKHSDNIINYIIQIEKDEYYLEGFIITKVRIIGNELFITKFNPLTIDTEITTINKSNYQIIGDMIYRFEDEQEKANFIRKEKIKKIL